MKPLVNAFLYLLFESTEDIPAFDKMLAMIGLLVYIYTAVLFTFIIIDVLI